MQQYKGMNYWNSKWVNSKQIVPMGKSQVEKNEDGCLKKTHTCSDWV